MESRAVRYLSLTLEMLRYRVAVMLWLFLLLSIAWHGGLDSFRWEYLWAALALASSYIAATTINDLADEAVDKINHPQGWGRPLVSGRGSRRDLIDIHLLWALAALMFGALLGWKGLGLMLLSLVINYLYSLRPIAVSYRTYLAPIILSAAYVLIPYSLGLVVSAGEWAVRDWWLFSSLLWLFFGRITLKDFRDRPGDQRYGKPTLLLTHGKFTTCLLSLLSVCLGGGALLWTLRDWPPALLACLTVLVTGVLAMLVRLYQAKGFAGEQVAIGLGARLGNALLLIILGVLILQQEEAPESVLAAFALLLTTFSITATYFLSRQPPHRILAGYRG